MGHRSVKMGGRTRWLDTVELLVTHLKKKTRKKAKGGDGKEPSTLPPEDWKVKASGW